MLRGVYSLSRFPFRSADIPTDIVHTKTQTQLVTRPAPEAWKVENGVGFLGPAPSNHFGVWGAL